MDVSSKVRAMRRRARCARHGHYWLQRMDDELNVTVFCGRCGRPESGLERLPRLTGSLRSL